MNSQPTEFRTRSAETANDREKRSRYHTSGLQALGVEVGRLGRFAVVGVIVTLTYAAVALLVIETSLAGIIGASIAGHIAAAVVGYIGHLRFSFAVEPDHQTYAWRFLVLAALTFAANIGMTWLLTRVIGVSDWVSIAIVTATIPIASYCFNRFWVFLPGLAHREP